jgi:CheY-like chemotaxis protein
VRTPPRILIVDDQPMNVDILKTRLAVHSYELLSATDGAEALAIASAQHPDLILLDIMMPKIDGIEVCQRLKADTSRPGPTPRTLWLASTPVPMNTSPSR